MHELPRFHFPQGYIGQLQHDLSHAGVRRMEASERTESLRQECRALRAEARRGLVLVAPGEGGVTGTKGWEGVESLSVEV
jgi:hypothetical protein